MVNTVTINLPELRNLSYRWELPTSIREACDYHFLDRLSYPQLADAITLAKDGTVQLEKHGIFFTAVFQNGSELIYSECLQRELKGDPCVHKSFWLSYRSMSYKWNGEVKTISIVLIQPARPKVRSGSQELEYLLSTTVVRPVDTPVRNSNSWATATFADRAAQAMESKENSDE